MAGAAFAYDRRRSENSRMSAFDIEILLYGKDGKALEGDDVAAFVREGYEEIWGWKMEEWEKSLSTLPGERRTSIIEAKSNMFWEFLAQQFAERAFGEGNTDPIFKQGPSCALAPCRSTRSLDAAHTVIVKTSIDGARDPLNPVTRSIYTSFTRGRVTRPFVVLHLEVPAGLRVASPRNETLDFRPDIGGRGNKPARIELFARAAEAVRTKGEDYPDFNLIYIPFRHLVAQGDVETPKRGTAFNYADLSAFRSATGALFEQLREPRTAEGVAARLTPFLTTKYYDMFGTDQNLKVFSQYILGEALGVRRGIAETFSELRMVVDGSVLIEK